MTDLPIACDLSPSDLARRGGDLLPGLVREAEERREVPGGYRWRLAAAPGLLQRIGTVLDAERACCRFFRFRVDVEPDGGAVWLEATGPEGTREFLAHLTTTE